MEPVIRITDKAADHLSEVLANRSEKAEQCLRLVIAPAGAGVVVDAPKNGDEVVCVGGRPTLLLHRLLARALEGAILDYQDYPEGPCLTLFK